VIVPDIAIASDGPGGTVAVFTRRPIGEVKTLALDLSSRTSVALTRVLCAKHWNIGQSSQPAEPDLEAMLQRADAAARHRRSRLRDSNPAKHRVTKIDLGAEWKALTDCRSSCDVGSGGPAPRRRRSALRCSTRRDQGVAHLAEIARAGRRRQRTGSSSGRCVPA
jgi:hypothetical protein